MTESPFEFDEKAAQNAVDFFRETLVHVKGELAGQPFMLDDWQARDIIRPLFGWKRKVDRTRRYRTVYVEIPRKNGKSSLGASLALYLLCADGEEGAEIYSAASDREQAAIIFDIAKQMRARSPELRKRLKPFKNSLVYHAMASSYKVLSADAETKHGFNAHAIIFDELHAQPNRKLYDVLTTSTGARRQPVTIFLTTAGYDRHSICFEIHGYAEKVRDGIIDDPSFLPVIYAVDKDEPWDDPTVWARANPGLGTSVKLEYLEEQAMRARASLAYQNTFRRLHLNQWCVAPDTLITMGDGTRRRAHELQPGDTILSFDSEANTLRTARVVQAKDNGIREVFRLLTARGRTIEVTGNHRFWCRAGRSDGPRYEWIEAAALRPGSRVAVALGAPSQRGGLQPAVAQFLGAMVGDGTCGKHGFVGITNSDPGVVGFMRAFAATRGCDLVLVPDGLAIHWRFRHKVHSLKTTGVRKLLKREGLDRKTCYDKRIPASVFRGGARAWAGFLSGYLDTDGHVASRSVIWISANQDLLSDGQHLLALLGVQSRLRPRRLEVHDADSLDILAATLTLAHTKKARRLAALRGLVRRTGSISRDRAAFDRVVSVQPVGDRQTVGIEIEDTHTHITNGLITHNTEQAKRAIDMDQWDRCAGPAIDLAALKGRKAYAGLDLASTSDLAALVLAIPDEEHGLIVIPRFWVPEENVRKRVTQDRVPYDTWIAQGLITATPGNIIDYEYIRKEINALHQVVEIAEIAYDRWGAVQLATQLEGDGFTMVPLGQGFQSLAAPTKELLKLIASRRLMHGGHPVLRWNASNLSVKQDAAGNLKPDKATSGEKIDGIAALVDALDRVMRNGTPTSVYEQRGLAHAGA